jgi:hypothetical protein
MPAIASSGVSYIRDDLNAGNWETSPGVYVLPSWDMAWLDYGSWIAAIGMKTKLPKWENEWGVGTTAIFNNTHQANFIARRLLQAAGLGVEIPSFMNF